MQRTDSTTMVGLKNRLAANRRRTVIAQPVLIALALAVFIGPNSCRWKRWHDVQVDCVLKPARSVP